MGAIEWLRSIAPQLEQWRAEDAARAQLHEAHVNAYLDSESCWDCGSAIAYGKRCAKCHCAYLEATAAQVERVLADDREMMAARSR